MSELTKTSIRRRKKMLVSGVSEPHFLYSGVTTRNTIIKSNGFTLSIPETFKLRLYYNTFLTHVFERGFQLTIINKYNQNIFGDGGIYFGGYQNGINRLIIYNNKVYYDIGAGTVTLFLLDPASDVFLVTRESLEMFYNIRNRCFTIKLNGVYKKNTITGTIWSLPVPLALIAAFGGVFTRFSTAGSGNCYDIIYNGNSYYPERTNFYRQPNPKTIH